MPWIDRERCIGCGGCIGACPSHALAQRDGKAAVTAPQACTYCAACEIVCPTGAIELPYIIVQPPTPTESKNE